jgi:hypothetical protein
MFQMIFMLQSMKEIDNPRRFTAPAVANDSNQVLGLDNVFIITTLKQVGPNFYVIA